MDKFRIYIVDDDPWYGEILEYYLSMNPDYEITRYLNANDCIANLTGNPDLITLDYTLNDANGAEVLEKIKRFNSDIPVIIISGQKDIATAIRLLKDGATDYFIKDSNTKDLLWNAIIRIRQHASLKKEVEFLKEELGQKYDAGKLIKGNSPAIQKVLKLIEKSVNTNINVSITGETGTGKELVAKAIHYNSSRSNRPFAAINMAAIPGELLESELFGYEKGAFTGAAARKKGRFEEANKGTLFLDEIAEMDLSLQTKLLRVIQERELVRVGGNERVPLDVRIVTATHKNLADEVRKGNFREDLYYRITGFPIDLPPLRERGSDILLLARYLLDDFCKANKMPQVTISQSAKDILLGYYFPGNVRELKSVIELASVMCSNSEIQAEDLTFSAASETWQFLTKERSLKEYDIEIIRHFLKKYDNNIVMVAKKLQIGKTTIYKLLKENKL